MLAVERFAGPAPKDLMELRAGTGETVTFLSAAGYWMTALHISEMKYTLLSRIAEKYLGATAIQGDYFTASIPEKFDAVCMFENFGMGTGQEQRSLLRRMEKNGSFNNKTWYI